MRLEVRHDRIHPRKLLVEFSALHAAVFFSPIVRKNPGHDVRLERDRGDEHATLHHELGDADAPEEGRFAPFVDAGYDHRVLAFCAHVVSDSSPTCVQRKADVVEA